MKKLCALFLSLFCAAVFAQGIPINCPDSGGNHLNYTTATHAWSCGTSSGGGVTIGGSVSGGTATRILYEGTGPVIADSANLTFGSSLLTVNGNSGNGLKLGDTLNSTYWGIWGSAVASPSISNYSIAATTSGSELNLRSTGDMFFVAGSATKGTLTGTAGAGLSITAGTAITDVPALSITRTNNNAAIITGVKFSFTDTNSAVGFIPFEVLGGASATTSLLAVTKTGSLIVAGGLATGSSLNVGGGITTGSQISLAAAAYLNWLNRTQISSPADGMLLLQNYAVNDFSLLQFGGTTSSFPALKKSGATLVARLADDSADAQISVSAIGLGSGKIAISASNPTLASGGCTGAAITGTPNGTARFSVNVGTSCSGSQPLVFTLPAATTGWNCYARNETNAATSAPAETNAASTTSVTITNFSRTLGTAAAWTDSDIVTVSCLGG